MSKSLSRRSFIPLSAGLAISATNEAFAIEDPPKKVISPMQTGPIEAKFERDYEAPKFKPSWKKEQINRTLVQDFVVFAHSEFDFVKKLLEKEPALLNAAVDWGNGDWETGLGGAAHMGRRDIVEYLLEKGARIDLFAAAMLGQLEAIKAFLTLQPKLIDAKGPHGFSLHFHAQVGGKDSENVLEYLQSIKKIELKPVPFLKKK
jgi:hypothetical protein